MRVCVYVYPFVDKTNRSLHYMPCIWMCVYVYIWMDMYACAYIYSRALCMAPKGSRYQGQE
jgi:hypothetical protein